MKKRIIMFSVLIFIIGLSFGVQGKYVRKQIKPNFFMPNSVNFNKPEKLPVVVIKKQIMKNTNINTDKNIPEYKKKFDQYNNDILYLAKYKKLPKNNLVVNDLRVMNSDNLIEYNVEESINSYNEFDKIVNNLLGYI